MRAARAPCTALSAQIKVRSENEDKEIDTHHQKGKGKTKGKANARKRPRQGHSEQNGTSAASSSEQHHGSQRNMEDVGFKRQRVVRIGEHTATGQLVPSFIFAITNAKTKLALVMPTLPKGGVPLLEL